MLNLLASFSVQQILTFSVLGALAFKGVVDFFEWCKALYNKKFNKDYEEIKEAENIKNHFAIYEKQRDEFLEKYNSLESKIDNLADQLDERIDKMETHLEILTNSDMHAIKGWIVEKHHNLIRQGWVDDFTMDTLEHRFSDYKAEDGNSYIASLMEEIKELPKFPPTKMDE